MTNLDFTQHPREVTSAFDTDAPYENAARPTSDGDLLRARLTAPIEARTVLIDVPGRTGVQIRCNTSLRFEDLERFQKRATVKGSKTVDGMRFNALVVSHLTVGIVVDGADTLPGFTHQETLDAFGATSAANAAMVLFGCPDRDADLNAVADDLVAECGWTRDDKGDLVSR